MMRSKMLRFSLEQCSSFREMGDVAQDVGASAEDLLEVLTPQETRTLEKVYSPYGGDQEWAAAREKLSAFADNVWLAVAFLRGHEDNQRVSRGEAPQWDAVYGFPSTD